MKCVECEERKAKFKDPRDPPLELEECVCEECFDWALEDAIADVEDNIGLLMKARRKN